MKQTIILQERPVEYTVKTFRRSRHVRLIVHAGGRVVVSAPKWTSARAIRQFMAEKADWLVRSIDYCQALAVEKTDDRADFLRHKEAARALIAERLDYFNTYYGFTYTRLTIRRQKTRWGSCSVSGALSFNYKLVLVPPELADYVIVHELCHLKEFNHSPDFWKLVARALPDYKAARARLKQLGLEML